MGEWPRLPLEGYLDLTYRCNCDCRHCWLRIGPRAKAQQRELSLEEIKNLVLEARKMGCQTWSISGGEPMLRPDFPEIFEFIVSKSVSYSLNTNGTRITPEIARLLRRRGSKMVALYGATAQVHDHITRTPGSFEATLQGMAYLKEAGAGFTVQLIPMRDNYRQFADMERLARGLSPVYRIGAAWLHFSACGSARRNAEIARQRLTPQEVVSLDRPDLFNDEWLAGQEGHACGGRTADDRLFAACIAHSRRFHIDPYGGMSFCCFVKEPAWRYELRRGSFREAWEVFIPRLADEVHGGSEYLENCAVCELRDDCRWCGVYGYLEHGRPGARVEYLCQVTRESRAFKENWRRHHRRYYEIAGVTILVEADQPFDDATFADKFKGFEVPGPGPDLISLRHHFSPPDLRERDLGREVYRQVPWAVYRQGSSWIYLIVSPEPEEASPHQVAVFNHDYTRGRIYHRTAALFHQGGLNSLTLFPTDQIWLAQVLADRKACFLHSGGVVLDGQGLLFVGHAGAGKSTLVKRLGARAEILSDDRNIVRRWPEGWRVHGTWSHGEVPRVLASSAPLSGIFFLRQADRNRIRRLTNRREVIGRLLSCLIKPLGTADWWEKMLTLMGALAREVPCYEMEFDRSSGIIAELEGLVHKPSSLSESMLEG